MQFVLFVNAAVILPYKQSFAVISFFKPDWMSFVFGFFALLCYQYIYSLKHIGGWFQKGAKYFWI